jgi:hypothetical protein
MVLAELGLLARVLKTPILHAAELPPALRNLCAQGPRI